MHFKQLPTILYQYLCRAYYVALLRYIFFIDTDSSRHIITTYLLCVICFRTCGHAGLIDFSLQKATLSKFANRHGDVRRHAPACVDLSGWPHGSCWFRWSEWRVALACVCNIANIFSHLPARKPIIDFSLQRATLPNFACRQCDPQKACAGSRAWHGGYSFWEVVFLIWIQGDPNELQKIAT